MPEVIIIPAFFVMVGFIVWVMVTGWTRRSRLKLILEFQSRLVDKAASAAEFGALLQSEGGAALLNGMAVDTAGTPVLERVVRAAAAGVVLVALATGLVVVGSRFGFENHEAFTIVGVIVMALGAGTILSAGVTYLLARQLDLAPGEPGNAR